MSLELKTQELSKITEDMNVTAVFTVDTVPPEEVTNITVDSYADKVIISWSHTDLAGDLASFGVYLGEDFIDTLDKDTKTITIENLNASTAYDVKVISTDAYGNPSTGLDFKVYTLIANPSGLSLTRGMAM